MDTHPVLTPPSNRRPSTLLVSGALGKKARKRGERQTHMIGSRVELARNKGRDAMVEPGFADLIVTTQVEKLRELVPTTSRLRRGSVVSSQVAQENDPQRETYRPPRSTSPCESRYGGVENVPLSV
jgi:hypothetical protein